MKSQPDLQTEFPTRGAAPSADDTLAHPHATRYEGLTEMESAFVDHYFRSGSQIQAARAAGYAQPESNASAVFHRPDVQAVLRRLHEENCLSGAEILSRLSAQARGSLELFLTFPTREVNPHPTNLSHPTGPSDPTDAPHHPVTPSPAHPHTHTPDCRIDLAKAASLGALGLIQQLSSGPQGPRIKLHSSQKALELLAKYLQVLAPPASCLPDPASTPKLPPFLQEQLEKVFGPESEWGKSTPIQDPTTNPAPNDVSHPGSLAANLPTPRPVPSPASPTGADRAAGKPLSENPLSAPEDLGWVEESSRGEVKSEPLNPEKHHTPTPTAPYSLTPTTELPPASNTRDLASPIQPVRASADCRVPTLAGVEPAIAGRSIHPHAPAHPGSLAGHWSEGGGQTQTATHAFLRSAQTAGCPPDQVRNLLNAHVILQPAQLRASAAARSCDLPDGPTRVGFGGARGGGKSHWALAQVVCDDCVRYPGLKALYLRRVGKAGREAVSDLRRQVLHHTPHVYRRSEGILQLPNESSVVLGHFQHESDIDTYLGLQYDVALIEEATQLTARKVRDIATCVRTSKPRWRPRVYYTTNPGNVGHAWFKKQFIDPLRSGREQDTRFIQATVDDNSFVNPGYRKELASLTGWQQRAWLQGDWEIAAGQFFTSFSREHHVCAPFELPHGWRSWCAMDYGYVHYTCVYLFAQSGDGMVYVVDEHFARGWLPRQHAPAIIAMLRRHGLRESDLYGFAAGDDVFSRGHDKDGLTIADQYGELGIRLDAANDDRINGAGELLARLGDPENGVAPQLIIFENCSRLIECLPALQHDPTCPEKVKKWDTDDDGEGGDDAYDACRYGLMQAVVPRKSWLDDPAYDPRDYHSPTITGDLYRLWS